MQPDRIDRVGLPNIKHVELYDKWRPLVPQNYWKDFVYFNEGPSAEKRKQVREEQQKSKRARRERQGDSTENTVTAQQQDQSTQP